MMQYLYHREIIVPTVIIYPPTGPIILVAASATGLTAPLNPSPKTPILIS
ncbi:hypothetical protein Q5M85_16805 [Paraclostridium bifermentans]|nr:hypothetical protein [Paraclostridium bifermentans]